MVGYRCECRWYDGVDCNFSEIEECGCNYFSHRLACGQKIFIGNDCKEAVKVVCAHYAIKESAKLRREPVFSSSFQGNTAVSIHHHCLTVLQHAITNISNLRFTDPCLSLPCLAPRGYCFSNGPSQTLVSEIKHIGAY